MSPDPVGRVYTIRYIQIFDSAPGCMADIVADRLNFTDQKPLEAMGEISGTESESVKTGSLSACIMGLELVRGLRTGLDFHLADCLWK